MRLALLFTFLLPAFFTLSSAKQKKSDQPKQEKFTVLVKNAKAALKDQSKQEVALKALLDARNRPELSNRQRADLYYTAALLEESLNGIENRKAYLSQAYDTAKFFNKLRDMYTQLQRCDSVDILPDATGKVHPRWQKKAQELRLRHHRNILEGGKFFLVKKNYAEAYPFFDIYCKYRAQEPDTLYPQAVLWATLSAFQVDNYFGTIKYVDDAISGTDSATAAILQEYKVRSYANLGIDSAWVASLKQGVENYPDHDYFFVQLADWYQGQRAFDEERRLADKLISRTGGKAIHYYAKSKSYLSEDNYDACIACADSTIALQSDFADAYYNKGIAFLNKALISQEMSSKDAKSPEYVADKRRTQELYRQAQPCMEMVRRLQPDKQERWASPLYRIYLNLNLGDDFTEIERLLNQQQ